jgi:hypothetical protein
MHKLNLIRAKKSGEEGQVIVEFVIVFSMITTLIFLFVQVSWGIAWGHYAHYATYMAARAYMAAGATKGEQYESAGTVLRQMLKAGGKDPFPFLSPSRAGGDRDATGAEPVPGAMVGTHPEAIGHTGSDPGDKGSRLYSWAEGVQYNFNMKLFLMPISKMVSDDGKGQSIKPGKGAFRGKAIAWKGMIPFTSDAFLGREPSVDECFREMNRLSTTTGINRGDNADFIEDNGC